MYSTILFPKDNEEALVTKAKKLGYQQHYFIYSEKSPKATTKPETNKQLRLCTRQTIVPLKQQGYITLMRTSSDQEVFEKQKPNIVYGLEWVDKKDAIHQRISGLNHILCKLAVKNNITLLYDLKEITETTEPLLHIILGRIRQNLMLCQKYGVKVILTFLTSDQREIPNPKDIVSFGIILGLSPEAAHQAVRFIF